MAVEKRFNLVSFKPDSQPDRLQLTLDGEWTIAGGLQPSLNTATVPASEISKLPDPPNDVRGSIEFWYSVAPGGGDPDVRLEGWYLVDIAPEQIGRRPGENADSVQVYRLCFADHRHGFVEPRGPRLRHGEINAHPLPPGAELTDNSILILLCLTAMNYPGAPAPNPAIVPGSVDEVAPMTPVRWDGQHAPAELAKLLKHCGHVYVPRNDGTGQIVRPNFGNLPTIPADRLSSVIAASSVDRRPRKVIFTSAPTAKTLTYGEGTAAPPSWRFVAQDHSDNFAWKPIDEIPALGSSEPAVRDHFRRGLDGVSDEWRDHYARQLYRAIQLDPGRFPPRQSAILRKVLYPPSQNLGRVDDPSVKVTVALRGRDGAWVNRAAVVKCKAIVAEEGVLVFEERLGAVVLQLADTTAAANSQRGDLEPFFLPAPDSNLKVTFSVEDWDTQKAQRVHAVFGFERIGLNVVAMDDAAAVGHLSGYRPDTAVYSCPELRLIESRAAAGAPVDNLESLRAIAAGYAHKLLVETADAIAQVAVAKGFYPVDLDGRVSEVRYNQERVDTTIVVNGWNVPVGPAGADDLPSAGDQGTDAVLASSDQPARQPQRSVAGAEAIVQEMRFLTGEGRRLTPASQIAPDAPPPTGFRPILVEVVAPIASQLGRYDARSFSGRIDVIGTGNLTKSSLGNQSAAVDCELLWYGDVAATSPGSLKAGDIIHGLAGPVRSSNGRVLVVATGPKLKKKTVVTDWTCPSGTPIVTKEDVWVWDA